MKFLKPLREWTELRLTDSSGKVQSASEPCLLLRYCPSGFSQLNVSCVHCCPSSWQDLFFFFSLLHYETVGNSFLIFRHFWYDLQVLKSSLFWPVPYMLAKLLQSCLTLCNPLDHSLPGSSVHGILQASILEWVALSSSGESSGPRDRARVSCLGSQVLYH